MAYILRGLGIGLQQTQQRTKARGIGIGLKQSQQRQSLHGWGLTDKPPIDKGEAWKEVFTGIRKNSGLQGPSLEIGPNTAVQCCFCLPVLAKTTGGDNYTNDQSAVRQGFGAFITAVDLELNLNGRKIADLNNNTYGTYFAYGFHEADGIKHVGYLIDWQSVLAAHGTGTYQVKFVTTDINTDNDATFSFPYKLRVYNDLWADDTVRLDFTQSQIFGNWEVPSESINLIGVNWFNQIRLPNALFGFPDTDYEKERYRQTNRVTVAVENSQERIYQLILGGLPYWVHYFLENEVLTSDSIFITDYNSTNPAGAGNIIDLGIDHQGGYERDWDGEAQEVAATLEFRLRKNNLQTKFC